VDHYVNGFLLHRESEGRSPRTLEWHRGALRVFTSWLRENGHDENPTTWDSTLIRRYFVHLQDRASARGGKLSSQSVKTYAISVRAFCRWLHDEEYIDTNMVERVAVPKSAQRVKDPFTTDDIRRLLAAAKADKRMGLRDYAVILFLLDSGCRASEVVGMKTADILWSQMLAKVYGKGSKERVVFLSAETLRAMQRYAMRAPQGADTFFRTEEGIEMTASGLLTLTKKLATRANVGNVHPHRFRHTFAITFLRSGGNVLALQRLLGHTTLTMTQHYVALVSDDLAREHVDHSPVVTMLRR